MKSPIPKEENDTFVPFNYPITQKKIYLETDFDLENVSFIEVLESRKSTCQFNSIDSKNFQKIIYLSNRIREVNIEKNGFITSKRIAPSAGGRHPIDLLISFPDEPTILHYYNPIDKSLSSLEIPVSKVESFIDHVSESLSLKNAALIWFSIQVEKTSSKYVNPESLYWRDAGALLYCIQLVSTYFGANSCPVGTLANEKFSLLFETEKLISGGGIVVG